VADGKSIIINSIIRDCSLNLSERKFSIDLIPMQLGGFDIIVGMDWFSQHRSEIIFFEKTIRVPCVDGQVLVVYGGKPSNGLKLMSCSKGQKYLRKNHVAFLAHIVDSHAKEKKIQDIPIVQDFPKFFPKRCDTLGKFHIGRGQE
jgi:hypothetical protein